MRADLDNGYTRIANEILEALARLDLSGREFRVALVIMRKTYGYQKKADRISRDQISELTGINNQNISRILGDLADKKIIVRDGGGYVKSVGINTTLSDWFHVEHSVETDTIQPTPIIQESVNSDTKECRIRHSVNSDTVLIPTLKSVESDTDSVENDTKECRIRHPQKKERKEIKIKESNSDDFKGFDFSGWPEMPSRQVWLDWKAHRKGKRAAISQTVINAMAPELSKANQQGYTVDYCLTQQQEAGWQGFKFDWLLSRENIYNRNVQRLPVNTRPIIESITDRSWAEKS